LLSCGLDLLGIQFFGFRLPGDEIQHNVEKVC
jgi:hypothetical protein